MFNNDQITSFSELTNKNKFKGDKITIADIVDHPITVVDFYFSNSQFDHNREYAAIQIIYNDEYRVVFTGSTVLIDQLRKNEDSLRGTKFNTTITHPNNYFKFI